MIKQKNNRHALLVTPNLCMLLWFPTCLVLLILTKATLQKETIVSLCHTTANILFFKTILSSTFQKLPFFNQLQVQNIDYLLFRKLVFSIKIIGPQKVSAILAPGLGKCLLATQLISIKAYFPAK